MKIGLALFLGVLALGALAANRLYGELNYFQILNGEVSRELNASGGGLADGGGLSLMTLDAGIGCNTLATGAVYKLVCDSPVHFCPWGDGGCSNAIGSQAYGEPVNASTPAAPYNFFFTLEPSTSATKLVCITPASGDATAICAPFKMR